MTNYGRLAKAIAAEHKIKAAVASGILKSLAATGAKEVTSAGKFSIPGLVMIKTHTKPATRACTKHVFGKMCVVAERPAKTLVKVSVNRDCRHTVWAKETWLQRV